MLIKLAVSAALGLSLSATAAALKDYENFNLPKKPGMADVPEATMSFRSPRLELKKTNPRLYEPGFDHKDYIFAKEAFLAEKRDEAIKLLRQDMDSGMKANRDNMLLRLGQLYAEKYMELSYDETQVFTKQIAEWETKKKTDPKAAKPGNDTGRSQKYLKDALALFYNLEREYPRHAKMDEIIFFIGFVEMESGNATKGLAYLERLIRQYPKSRKYDEAVVYLADQQFDTHHFREAMAKYRILLSRQASPLYHYAVYKIAWCELNTFQGKKALADMKGLIAALDGTQDKAKFNLREQAIKDLVVFYGEVGNVDEAFAYFNEAVGKDKALENLKLIADILRSKAQDEQAVRAYTRLLREYGDSPEAPKIWLALYESASRLGKPQQAMNDLVQAIEKYGPNSDWAKAQSPDKAADVKATQDTLAAEAEKIALFYHHSAQKASNRGSYGVALRLYTAILNAFPNHPDKKKITFYRAEILFQDGKYLDAANGYMEAAKIAPKDRLTDECVYNALLALDRLTAKNEKLERFTKEQLKTVDQTPEEIPGDERRFIEIAEYYLQEYPKGERVVDVRFRIAAIYYRYHHFDKSVALFKDIALQHPTHRSAPTAAHIVLDIYNIKKDYVSLDANAGVFANTKGLGDATFKSEMAQISSEIGFKKIETFEGDSKWREAGDSYLSFYKNNPNAPLAEKSLYNAYVSYEKSGDAVKTTEASRLFIAKYPKSPYTEKMLLANAKLAEKIFDYDSAQRQYYDFYKKYPHNKEAKKALYNSAVFAELLEMNKQSISLYNEYLKFGDARSISEGERKAIQISQAKLYRKDGDVENMAKTYRRLIYQSKSQDEKLQLMAELARQYERAGKTDEKDKMVNQIRYTAKDSKGLTGQAAQYVAEAQFHALDKQRQRYEEVVLKFPAQDLVYLLKRKEKLLSKLSASYDGIVAMGVPEWGVAALLEKSQAYENFITGFRTIKVPAKLEQDKETQDALKGLDAQIVKPLETKQQEYLKVCVDKAAEFHVVNEYAAKCREKLKKTGNEAEPSGLTPQPSYWSTRALSEGVATK